MKKLKVVALLVVMVCGLVGCKEDVEVHTEYAKAQPIQLYTEEVVQETAEQVKVSAEIAIEEAEKEEVKEELIDKEEMLKGELII